MAPTLTTCTHCGVEIVPDGRDGWGDADAPDLVYCTDQDETYDGIKHEPHRDDLIAPRS